jgi:hypothetical protein
MHLNCPHCQKYLEAPVELSGKLVQCMHCRGLVEIPATEPKRPADEGSTRLPGAILGALTALMVCGTVYAVAGAYVFGPVAWPIATAFWALTVVVMLCSAKIVAGKVQ